MRCAYSSITCPADTRVPGHRGGDIVAAVETAAAVRLLVGDVMGHGPTARKIATRVACAFTGLAGHGQDPPQVVAARLDQTIAGMEGCEKFVTAQFIDIPHSGDEPRIVCCGHPVPLVLRDGGAVFLDAVPPAAPLGLLGLAGGACPRSAPLGLLPGETVLFYTDGVTEARDADGAFYPLPARAAAIARELDLEPALGALPRRLANDLRAHVGGTLRDDATLMCLRLADGPGSGNRARTASGTRNEADSISVAAE